MQHLAPGERERRLDRVQYVVRPLQRARVPPEHRRLEQLPRLPDPVTLPHVPPLPVDVNSAEAIRPRRAGSGDFRGVRRATCA
ncbi:hypothetical protein GCM10009566_29500 [Streptomyces murinus]